MSKIEEKIDRFLGNVDEWKAVNVRSLKGLGLEPNSTYSDRQVKVKIKRGGGKGIPQWVDIERTTGQMIELSTGETVDPKEVIEIKVKK